ncbi:hypothetical protein WJX84_002271 [Apatococcus fuscideae]|uniref:Uncharacterized protein n=1 Tax=Apatococcus fuscideae TaxID=2026836 RepID=A0AAW1T1T8_9CHLO
MSIQVHLTAGQASNSATYPRETTSITLSCGAGRQILGWVAAASCARFAHLRMLDARQVQPQSIMTMDGHILDPSVLVCAFLKESNEVQVQYGPGPLAFNSRWQGRPEDVPFSWSTKGEVLPLHDSWLKEMDMSKCSLASLQRPGVQPASFQADLNAAREVLVANAGHLQTLFLVTNFQGTDVPLDLIGHMTQSQFRNLLTAAKVMGPQLPAEAAEDAFLQAAQAFKGFTSASTQAPTLSLRAFFIALLRQMLDVCLIPNTHPAMAEKVAIYELGHTPACTELQQKARKLTEKTLEVCQYRRSAPGHVTLELPQLTQYLTAWKLLGNEFLLSDLAWMVVFGKHGYLSAGGKQRPSEIAAHKLQPWPICLDANEFEFLLSAIATLLKDVAEAERCTR